MGNTCCMSFHPLHWTGMTELCPIINTSNHFKHPVQCVENPEPQASIVVFDSEYLHNNYHSTDPAKISVQCLDNPDGEDGVVVTDQLSFPIAAAFRCCVLT